MRLDVTLRHLVLASWPTDRESVVRALPPGLEPAEVDGEHLVTAVAFRCAAGRLGRLPVLPFSQLNVRTYVVHDGEPAVFFLRANVTTAGLAGAFFGAPYRPARIRVDRGEVEARALGLSLRYDVGEPTDAGPLGRHELGLFEAAGIRGFRIRRGPAEWRTASPTAKPRTDVLLALGFDLAGEPRLLYAESGGFECEVPPRAMTSVSRSGSSA